MHACERDCTPDHIVSLLLERGADVNRQSNEGDTALVMLARRGDSTKIQLLIRHNADVNYRNGRGRTALMEYDQNFNKGVAGLEALLQAGAEVDAQDCDGNSALMLCVKNSQTTAVSALLKHGARVDMANHERMTAVQLAEVLSSAHSGSNAARQIYLQVRQRAQGVVGLR